MRFRVATRRTLIILLYSGVSLINGYIGIPVPQRQQQESDITWRLWAWISIAETGSWEGKKKKWLSEEPSETDDSQASKWLRDESIVRRYEVKVD